MSKIHKEQAGFSAIETILVIVIVGAIGFVGWYVYHSKQNSDAVLNTASTVSASTTGKKATTSSSQPAAGTDNQSLQSDLSGLATSNNQSNSDLSNSNSSLNDQSTFTTVPQ